MDTTNGQSAVCKFHTAARPQSRFEACPILFEVLAIARRSETDCKAERNCSSGPGSATVTQ